LPSNIKIGTSGWSYKEWEKVFYPDSETSKLTYYSGTFNTAEIDSTFYANPTKGLIFGWLRNTPRDFQFSAKLPQTITHKKQMDLAQGIEVDLDNFLELMKPLNDAKKLGPLLIQLPPSFDFGKFDRLEQFFDVLPKEFLFAIELRNKSWLGEPQRDDVYTLLSHYNIANTIVDEPLLPVDLTTTSKEFAFIRWHGKGKRIWYDYRYGEEELTPWIERVKDVSSKTKNVYGYFNNHFNGYAVENSLWLLEKLDLANEIQQRTLNEVHDTLEKNGAH
jgi:uncharacterized protein YecE (DUF72 family)